MSSLELIKTAGTKDTTMSPLKDKNISYLQQQKDQLINSNADKQVRHLHKILHENYKIALQQLTDLH